MLTDKILDPVLAGRLEQYRLVRLQPVTGGYAGSRRSPRKGGAVEFADYREYAAGDEPRRVDWKAYARLGRLYVKEYLDEKQDAVLFIVDTSASMNWGAGDEHKGRFALGLSAGLGACVLVGNDRLAVTAGPGLTAGPGSVTYFAPVQGRRSLPRLWHWLADRVFAGGTDLAGGLRDGLRLQPGTTGLYVFSDLLDPNGVEDMLRMAAGRGIAVTLLHILAPGELEPPGEGEWTMIDSETGEPVEVSLTPSALRDYSARLKQHIAALEQSCRRWKAGRVQINTGRSLADALLLDLPRAGVLKHY
ncbi:MAG: DUF58 domain-containing protein [Firmicutes bacterium]|nr:DUF58 domain-containing protein [Bacillota bacterium]